MEGVGAGRVYRKEVGRRKRAFLFVIRVYELRKGVF